MRPSTAVWFRGVLSALRAPSNRGGEQDHEQDGRELAAPEGLHPAPASERLQLEAAGLLYMTRSSLCVVSLM